MTGSQRQALLWSSPLDRNHTELGPHGLHLSPHRFSGGKPHSRADKNLPHAVNAALTPISPDTTHRISLILSVSWYR